ncbi:MAG TPA: hypothetical protein DCL44_08440 [Elusimicrobia bacterium]|nr:hypothetical protein [Elusimicrobiota bacterium]
MEFQPVSKNALYNAKLAGAIFLFVFFTLLYIYCLPPGLAPYRDAGEMACDAYSLGVAHQPGYPLYTVTARFFSMLSLGNFAWAMNLFSAAAGLGAIIVFYALLCALFSPSSAAAAALLLGLNFTFWTVSSVSEMYALNVLLACLILFLSFESAGAYSKNRIFLLAYLAGLSMTNRMDIVFVFPAAGILVFPALKNAWRGAWAVNLLKASGLFALGFSLYLYLLVRSGSNPLFDWSHPADFASLIAVITRKSYGSTLDLISKNYAAGELFIPNLKYYALHLFDNFNLALFAACAGIYSEFIFFKRRCLAMAALFLLAGPVFLLMGNMPPNPHALAVVEPYYLLPDLAVLFWIAAGLFYAGERFRRLWPLIFLTAIAAALWAFHLNFPGADRRELFAAEDYAADALRSVPPGGLLVAKKDVQLFSLWYAQTVKKIRPDISAVAQGLSASSWYRNTKRLYSPGLVLFNLNSGSEEDWRSFRSANRGGLYSTLDAELPAKVATAPAGLVNAIYPSSPADVFYPLPLYSFRFLGRPYRDFFDRDIGTSYAQSLVAKAVFLNGSSGLDHGAVEGLALSERFDSDIPDAPLYAGFYYSSKGDWKRAGENFSASAEIYGRLLELSREYHSLDSLKRGLEASSAYAWLNYGVTIEKTGNPVQAEVAYRRALAADPGLAQAHYNIAILYWKKDPDRVYSELVETLKLNPAHKEAAYYLQRMKQRK